MKKISLKAIAVSLLFVVTGSVGFYLNGHKDSDWFNWFYQLLLIIGWISLFFSTIGRKVSKMPLRGKKSSRDKWYSILSYLLMGGVILTHFILMSSLVQDRVKHILESKATRTTTATVIKLDKRKSRGVDRIYAIIQYQAEDKEIIQSAYNYSNQYSLGQQLLVKYAVEHPEMFTIVHVLEKEN